jgi:hypothetical protein
VQAEENLGGFAIAEGGIAERVLDGHEEGTASEDLLSGEHALPLSIHKGGVHGRSFLGLGQRLDRLDDLVLVPGVV